MAKSRGKSRRGGKRPRANRLAPQESQAGVAITVAWTVAVTMALACDVAAIVAHLYARSNPEAVRVGLFRDLVTFAGMLIGAAVLGLIPVVYRMRRVPPPTGFVVFAACAAGAPIVAFVVRAVR